MVNERTGAAGATLRLWAVGYFVASWLFMGNEPDLGVALALLTSFLVGPLMALLVATFPRPAAGPVKTLALVPRPRPGG
jgi:hypothetical protein